jgi:hypothetical protein
MQESVHYWRHFNAYVQTVGFQYVMLQSTGLRMCINIYFNQTSWLKVGLKNMVTLT